MWRWKKYVPVADRKAKAKKKINQLKKKGKAIEPIEIQGRSIAKKFWGKKWCEHLESFSDYSNRLPRGRTYVRNGSVCHLGIKKGIVEAIVSGSSLYSVEVKISTLGKGKWKLIKDKSRGEIGSLLELLKGKLSDNIMEVVADHNQGLFPNDEEIHFSCSCPDWADMCKHVAAVLYGIGSRLDEQPDLLFLLRGVDASELITTKLSTTAKETDDLMDDEGLSDIFGIDLDDRDDVQTSNERKQKKTVRKTASKKQLVDLTTLTGKQLQVIRTGMNMTVPKFAEALKVTPASVYRWEKKSGILKLHERSSKAIAVLLAHR